MDERQRPAMVPRPPYEWVAMVIAGAAGAASIGGLTWADAPGILDKALIAAGLTAAVVAVLFFVIRPSRR